MPYIGAERRNLVFDESLGMYTAKVNGVTVAYEDEASANDLDRANTVASLYYKRLDEIIAFMMPDLREMYGETDAKNRKGKPWHAHRLSRYVCY